MSEPSVKADLRNEVLRILRVSDMLATGHSNLRDKFKRRAFVMDVSIIASSVWLTSVVFVEPKIGLTLTPFHLDPQIWVGLLSIATLFLSVAQLRVDWKGQSDSHGRCCEMHSRIKAKCRNLLESKEVLVREDAHELFTQYGLSSELGCPIPENEFLRQKNKHLTKVVISRFLDKHPAASVGVLKLRLWWRSNITTRRDQLE